jgi:hypothetical protein
MQQVELVGRVVHEVDAASGWRDREPNNAPAPGGEPERSRKRIAT